MTDLSAAWRRWLPKPGQANPAWDAARAVVLTVVLLIGSYGEGNPKSVSDVDQFRGQPVPHPTGALALVAVACLALAWRRRYPVTVLAVSVAAVAVYSLLGYVNGAVLIAPLLGLSAVATQVSARRAVPAAAATLAVLMAVTAANNPFGQISGG